MATRRSAKRQVAVMVLGNKNATRITFPVDLTEQGLEGLAKIVRMKEPGRIYYAVEVIDRRRGFVKGETLYVWHVGDGFDHADGWWISVDE